MSADLDALLPCPFCGPGQSIVSVELSELSMRYYAACGACGSCSGHTKAKAGAIAAWNRRAAPDEAERITAALYDAGWIKSAGSMTTLAPVAEVIRATLARRPT